MIRSQLHRRRFLRGSSNLLGVLLIDAAHSRVTTAASTRPEKVIDELYAAYQRLDVTRMMELIADDCFFEDPTFHLIARGKTEIKKMVDSSFPNVSNMKIAIENRIVSSDWVITQQRLSAVIKRNVEGNQRSKVISVRGATIFRVKSGKITQWHDYYDFDTYKKQMA